MPRGPRCDPLEPGGPEPRGPDGPSASMKKRAIMGIAPGRDGDRQDSGIQDSDFGLGA